MGPDGHICERVHPQLHQPANPREDHPAGLPATARGAAGAFQRAGNLLASKGNFATLSSFSSSFFFELFSDQVLSWVLHVNLVQDLTLGSPLILLGICDKLV